ncbi:trinucleotide repeat-containing gene 6C protein-like isoform X3 [Lineus longissimus]|uniref:trinucleotide repeat-containing gene 6C protein-like isoform X3 n=1 Tax=Lineus longissimus TaxID=88925 RepID=UPI00315DC71E
MASHDQDDCYHRLKLESDCAVVDIQRAYRSLALQYHPDRPNNKDKCSVAKFEEVTKAYWKLTSSCYEDRDVDSNKVFFKLFKDVLLSRKGDLSIYAFFTNTHVGVRGQVDDMCIENDEENDTGEQEFETFVEIVENRRKKGKLIPNEFTPEKLEILRETLLEEKEAAKEEISKKLNSQKVKPSNQVPVSKPKPKSKKQKAAEQRRRERSEIEKQKRQEEEKARQAAEDKRRREKEEKERIEREKREREEEEARLRDEEKRREKEEKKKKAAAAKQLKQQAEQKAKEDEEKKKQKQTDQQQAVNNKPKSPQQNSSPLLQTQQQKSQQYPPREVPPRFAQKQQQQKQQKMQQGGKKGSQWGGPGWGDDDEANNWSLGPQTTGSGWTEGYSASHQGDSQEIGTWQNPESSWGGSANTNDIIVDTKDKEAWPSIGADQGSNASEAGDDNASVKSGSVISSSSNPGQQGQESSQGSSAIKSQSASNGWGGTPNDTKMDANSPWGFGAANPSGNMNSTGWGGNPPTSAAVSNQGLHMQSFQNVAAGDNALNSGLGGWGMNNAAQGSNQRPQNAMQAQKPGAQFIDNNGPQMAANKPPGAIGNPVLWQGISNLGTGVHKPQVNQDTAWNISDSGNASNMGKSDGTAIRNGTDQWGGATQQQNWGAPGAKQNNSKGWGQPSPVPSPNPVNPATGWNPQQPDKTSIPQQSGGWGNLPPPQNSTAQGPPPAQWGAQNTPMNTPMNANPAKTQPSTWAQAAGKGLVSSANTVRNPSNTAANNAPNERHLGNMEISRAVNAKDGWGQRPVKQDLSWESEVSPRTKRREIESANSNVWNTQVNNGTAIWENQKQAMPNAVVQPPQPPPQQQNWNSESRVSTSSSGSGGWGDNNDYASSNTWNGPPPQESSNNWGAPPPPQQQPQPDKNNWMNTSANPNPSANVAWGSANGSHSQGQNQWGGPKPPDTSGGTNWGAAPGPRGSTSSWDGAGSNRSSGSWGDNNGQKSNPSGGWGDAASSGASGNAGAAGGGNSAGPPVGWGEPPPAMPPQRTSTSSWDGGNNRGNGGGGGWAEPPPPPPQLQKKEIKPMGWEEPSPPTQRKNIDTGTSYWGDPSASQTKPVSNWNSVSTPTTPNTPTPRPKPDDVSAVWDKQPPSSQPERGWGDISQQQKVDSGGNALWTSAIGPPPQAKGSGWENNPQNQANQWNSGAKPKTPSSSSWGTTTIDSWNKPNEPGQAWPDDVSVWGEDDSVVQENASWSSAKDWTKKKAAMKDAVSFQGATMAGSYKNQPQMRIKLLQQLMDMGFKKEDAQNALISNNMNLDSAIADLIAGANADRNKDIDMTDPQKAALLKVRSMQRLHDSANNGNDEHADIHSDSNQYVPPNSMQNTQPFSSAQSQVPNPQAIALKQGPSLTASSLGSLTNTSISPSLQQKIIQHPLLGQQQQQQQPPPPQQQQPQQPPPQQQEVLQQGQNLAQGQRGGLIPGGQSVQQQLVQHQLVQQLRMAVQAGLISPQILYQQFNTQMLSILQQLLQQQNILQRLMTQQQMIQNKTPVNNPMAQRQQLEQVNLMIQKIKQQIVILQGQLTQAQQGYNKQAGAGGMKDMQGGSPNDLVSGLQSEFGNFSMKDAAPPQQTQSRLTQWKLPSPEKDGMSDDPASGGTPPISDSTLNKAPGSKPITQSHSSSNLQAQSSKFDFHRSLSIGGDSTWSALTSTSESDWPTTTATPTSSVSSVLESSKENPDNASKESLGGTPSATPPNSAGSTFNLNDMIPEFIPGKPWQGVANKNIEDDPHITPGSISRSLSVNTIKDEYLNNLTKQQAVSNTTGDSTSSSSTWAYSNFPKSTAIPQAKTSNWPNSASITPTSLTSELWGVPVPSKAAATRPPPGLTNQKNLWGSSSGQQQQQQQQQPNFNRSISWGGDKSAFTAGAKKGAPPQPDSSPQSSRNANVSNQSWDGRSSSSNWLVLKNLTPQIDGSTLKTLCMQHGPLLMFHLNLNYGQALVQYQSRDEAMKAQKSLNACVLGNTTIMAEFANENDLAQLSDQNVNTSSSSLWSQQSQPQQTPSHSTPQPAIHQQQHMIRSQGHQMNMKYESNTSQWNGANLGGLQGGMWSTGTSNLWGSSGLSHGLLPGDLLGGESM